VAGASCFCSGVRWETWGSDEVVVIPGGPAHIELWVGSEPERIKAATLDDTILFPPDYPTFAPVTLALGLIRSNATPMPEVEAFYDNVVVTTPSR
jgi:hypothetical protein